MCLSGNVSLLRVLIKGTLLWLFHKMPPSPPTASQLWENHCLKQAKKIIKSSSNKFHSPFTQWVNVLFSFKSLKLRGVLFKRSFWDRTFNGKIKSTRTTDTGAAITLNYLTGVFIFSNIQLRIQSPIMLCWFHWEYSTVFSPAFWTHTCLALIISHPFILSFIYV